MSGSAAFAAKDELVLVTIAISGHDPPLAVRGRTSQVIGIVSINLDFWPILKAQGFVVKTILAECVLIAFFVRDLRLLVAAGQSRIVWACAAYAALFFSYAAALAGLLGFAEIYNPGLLTISGRTWGSILAVHAVLSGITWHLSKGGTGRGVWMVALAPSPAILLSFCFVAHAFPETIEISLGLLSLPLFGVVWIGLIVPLAYEMVKEAASDGFSSIRSLRIVALLSLSSVLCFVGQLGRSGVLPGTFGGER